MLTVRHVLKVNIGVSQRSPGDHVTANSNRQDGTDRAEFFEQHSFGHVRMQVPNVQRSHLDLLKRVTVDEKNKLTKYAIYFFTDFASG